MSGSTVDFGIEFLDGFSAVDQDIGPCVIGHEDGVIVRVLGDVGQDVVLVQVACQCDIHRHLGQLIAILDEAVGQLRVRAVLHLEKGKFNYAMSILKSNNGNPESCNRYTFAYSDVPAGEGHFISTYMHDGNPLLSFEGEPKWMAIPDDMDAFADTLWNSLNEENKVSLFVRYIDIATGKYESKIINKNN